MITLYQLAVPSGGWRAVVQILVAVAVACDAMRVAVGQAAGTRPK